MQLRLQTLLPMSYRFVVQRDLDGTWSVREVANNSRAIYRGKLLAGLTEEVAALNARMLNDRIETVDGFVASAVACPPLVTRIQETISSPLPRSLKNA